MYIIMKVYIYCNSWYNIGNILGIYYLRLEEEFYYYKIGFN